MMEIQVLNNLVISNYSKWGNPDGKVALWIPSRSPMRRGQGDIRLQPLNVRGQPRGSTMLTPEASVIVNDEGQVITNRFGRDSCHVTSLPKDEGGREACEAWAEILRERVQKTYPRW